LSVVTLVGAKPCLRSNLRISLTARGSASTTLDQDLKDLAFVVDGTPQIHVLACDPDDHFVEMPAIARSRRHCRRRRAIAGPNLSTQLRTLS
jgi:hypothetical protein